MAFISVETLGRKVRATELDTQQRKAALLRAQIARLRLRLQPAVLFRALDAALDAVRGAPERAEHTITRMGDLLRGLLSARNRELSPLDDEMDLLAAFLDVVGATEIHGVPTDDLRFLTARIPATITAPIAASMERVRAVDVALRDEKIVITFTSDADRVDGDAIDAIGDRLRACYGLRATLSVARSEAGGTLVQLTTPLDIHAPGGVEASDSALALAG